MRCMPKDAATVTAMRGLRSGALVVVIALAAGAAGCSSSLPEAGSPAAELYARRCGACHPPYNPKLLTAKMWQTMVDRMETMIKRQGMELTPSEKATILDYVSRNAGTS